MECPYCGNNHNKVKDSRLAKGGITIRRRRRCLACSERFTTYESTGERLLPFLIVKNSGQGATIPNVKTMLSFLSSTLTVLSEETEKLIDKVGKLEKTQVARESKRMAASKKKAPAKKKAEPLTSTDQVAKVIKRHIQPAEGDILEEKSNWVKAKAARLLNINRTTLVAKIKNQNLTEGASP